MSDNTVAITVNLALKTCSCGTMYGVPTWVYSNSCPMCGEQERKRLDNLINEAYEREQKFKHVIAGLQGALKRKRQ